MSTVFYNEDGTEAVLSPEEYRAAMVELRRVNRLHSASTSTSASPSDALLGAIFGANTPEERRKAEAARAAKAAKERASAAKLEASRKAYAEKAARWAAEAAYAKSPEGIAAAKALAEKEAAFKEQAAREAAERHKAHVAAMDSEAAKAAALKADIEAAHESAEMQVICIGFDEAHHLGGGRWLQCPGAPAGSEVIVTSVMLEGRMVRPDYKFWGMA